MDWTHAEAKQVIEEAYRRSATDPAFRKLLLSDAAKAVEKLAGKPAPPNLRIRVLEREGADMVVTLPDPPRADMELSDMELEQVAGGGRGGGCGATACAVTL